MPNWPGTVVCKKEISLEMTTDVAAKLAYSRKELLDLGLRNPLINFRVRANKIDAVDEAHGRLVHVRQIQ